ncbi:MAG: signal peptidase I [Chlamydiales bacterium]|jgi:signal peptidase I
MVSQLPPQPPPTPAGVIRERAAEGAPLDLLRPPLEPAPPWPRSAVSLRTRVDDIRTVRARGRRVLSSSAKALFILVLVWGLLFNFSEVRGSSMKPGIHDRDRILVDHLSYMFSEVERGDIVVLRYPLDPSLDYIKRVVGLPGDEVSIRGDQVYVNGKLFDEPYVNAEFADPYTHMSATVKPHHVFVLGDNRLRSSDSREFGQVDMGLLRGKVRFRLWPLGRAGWVE